MAAYLGVLIAALAADMAAWHLVVSRLDAAAPVGAAAGLAAALIVVSLSRLSRRAKLLLAVSAIFCAALSLALIARMPLLQPLAAKALAGISALAFALAGFRLYLRKRD